jgi:hypothetical protein
VTVDSIAPQSTAQRRTAHGALRLLHPEKNARKLPATTGSEGYGNACDDAKAAFSVRGEEIQEMVMWWRMAADL